MQKITFSSLIFSVLLGPCLAWSTPIDYANLDWSVDYLIDESQDVLSQPQNDFPRDNRGLAISPNGDFLYAGYNNTDLNPTANLGVVRQIRRSDGAVLAQVSDARGKAIAVDDQGRVYLAQGSAIDIYNADLNSLLFSITSGLTNSEGVAVVRDAEGQLVLYHSDRNDGTLTKQLLTESGGAIIAATIDTSFGTDGVVTLGVGISPRGVEVDNSGRIWVAGRDSSTLYRVSSDGATVLPVTMATNATPMDIGIDGDNLLVTRYEERIVSRYDAETGVFIEDVGIPWITLELDPDGQDGHGALSGIVVLPGDGFYLANETGQTADDRSTYGVVDGNSGVDGGAFFTDLLNDDNDPILFAGNLPLLTPPSIPFSGLSMLANPSQVPVAPTLLLFLGGLLGLLRMSSAAPRSH